jgi:hypothetical protein
MMYAGMHNPTHARVNDLGPHGASLKFMDDEGGEMVIFTTLDAAKAIADAFNAALGHKEANT